MKILYVSDSLAANVHPRGIFTFSIGLLEILAANGHEIHLLVEDFSAAKISRRISSASSLDELATNTAAVASHLTNYSGNQSSRGNWFKILNKIPLLRRFAGRLIDTLAVVRASLTTATLSNYKVDSVKVDFSTQKSSVLRFVKGVSVAENVFFAAKVSGTLGFRGPAIETSAFDLVIVDTPTNIRVLHSKNRVVQVVHDLIPLTDPTLNGLSRNRFASAFPFMMKHYKNYVFVSEFTRQKFCDLVPNFEFNSCVFYPRIQPLLLESRPAASPSSDVSVKKIKYALLIVSDEPRKNIEKAIESALLYQGGVLLYVIGQIRSPEFAKLVKANPQVKALGYVSDTHKAILIAGAECVVVPAFAEGFGLPIAEALALGTPVACSDIALFHEVAGEHATYFDPYNPGSIADAVNSIVENPPVDRASLKEAAKRFNVNYSSSELLEFMASAGLDVDAKQGEMA